VQTLYPDRGQGYLLVARNARRAALDAPSAYSTRSGMAGKTQGVEQVIS